MSFSVSPKAGPTVISPVNTTPNVAARERAIARLMEGAAPQQAQDSPVANPTSVQPEEMTAISSESKEKEEDGEEKVEASKPSESEQKDISEDEKSETEVTEEKKVEDPLSTQYAMLARKEKALRAKVQALQAEKDALKAQEEALKAKDAEYQTKFVPKDRLTNETLQVLSELGITYDQLTNLVLNAPKPEEMAFTAETRKLQAEIKAIKEAQEAAQKSATEQQERNYQAALNQLRADTKKLVESDSDFETIKETGSVDDVVELIERTFKEDGVLMTVEEAAREVENYLVEEALKLARLKKIQSKLAPSVEKKAAEPTKKATAPSQPSTKTLTNAVGTSRPMTARERAIAAFEAKKNS